MYVLAILLSGLAMALLYFIIEFSLLAAGTPP
jgi:hypothetical protein